MLRRPKKPVSSSNLRPTASGYLDSKAAKEAEKFAAAETRGTVPQVCYYSSCCCRCCCSFRIGLLLLMLQRRAGAEVIKQNAWEATRGRFPAAVAAAAAEGRFGLALLLRCSSSFGPLLCATESKINSCSELLRAKTTKRRKKKKWQQQRLVFGCCCQASEESGAPTDCITTEDGAGQPFALKRLFFYVFCNSNNHLINLLKN